MDKIKLKGTSDTPSVILDKESGIFEFSGRSLPEDAIKFYEPILNWIKEYGKSPNPQTVLVFKFDYFNTASSKVIMIIMRHFEKIKEAGNDVLIQWCFADDDDEMQEAGKDYSAMIRVPMEIISY